MQPRPAGGRRAALAILCALLFLTFLDNTIVSVVLGDIQPDLHAGVTDLQWVVNGYALVFAAVMLPAGAISDEFGRKKVMLSGLGLFCCGSVIAALAWNPPALIAGRVVMGLGAAGSEPGTLSMLRHIYPREPSRARAIGVWAAVSGLALALGPVVGGVLTGAAGWRSVFWFNLALGAVLLAAAARVLPESADPQAHRVDAAGGLLSGMAVAAAVFGVVEGETAGYGAPLVDAMFAVAAVTAVAFVVRQRTATHPLLDPHVVRAPGFWVPNLAAFTTYFGTFAIFFFTALYLQEIAGYSGYRIAVQFAPMTAALVVAALLAGRWSGRIPPRWPVTAGCLVFAAGLLLTDAELTPNPGYGALAIALAVAGFGVGLTVVPITDAAMSAVPARRSGMAASATNTSRELGAVVGVAALGALVNARLTSDLTAALHRLGIPANFNSLIINAVEHGGLPSSGNTAGAGGAAAAQHQSLVQHVIHAAYSAFGAGLHVALDTSAALTAATAVVAVIALRVRTRPAAETYAPPREPTDITRRSEKR